MPDLKLRYGMHTVAVSLPRERHIEFLKTAPPKTEQSEFMTVRAALNAPIASPHLQQFLDSSDTVALIVSDKTRRCRSEFFLPILLEEIHRAGVAKENIIIVFANGTHSPQSETEMRAILGDAIYDAYHVVQHNAHDAGSVEYTGTTAYGTEVLLNKHVTHASKVIATGTIVHHYFAGFGGGAKLFMPGVAAYSTAVVNHRRTLTAEGTFHPACRDGSVDTNPVALDILDAVRFFPPTFYFATVLNEDGMIEHAVCGDLRSAHTRGCEIVDAIYRCPFQELADLTIVSAGGYPKDINFIQAHKALHHAAYATRPGGVIFFLAECIEGIGNDDFLQWFTLAPDELDSAIKNHYTMNAHTAIAMQSKAGDYSIYFKSSLPEQNVTMMGMCPVSDLQISMDRICESLSPNAVVYVIENGALVVPTKTQ